jgi:hypothetical protein
VESKWTEALGREDDIAEGVDVLETVSIKVAYFCQIHSNTYPARSAI